MISDGLEGDISYKNILPEMLTILPELPFFLFTNSMYGVRACVEQSSSGNIQVTEYMRRFTSITLLPS